MRNCEQKPFSLQNRWKMGGIGSGKSSVSEIFEGLGVKVVDADVASRQDEHASIYKSTQLPIVILILIHIPSQQAKTTKQWSRKRGCL